MKIAWTIAKLAAVPLSVALRGNVEHALTLPVDELKQLPVQRIDDVHVVPAKRAGRKSRQRGRLGS